MCLVLIISEPPNVISPIVSAVKFGHWERWHWSDFSVVKVPSQFPLVFNK